MKSYRKILFEKIEEDKGRYAALGGEDKGRYFLRSYRNIKDDTWACGCSASKESVK